MLLKLENIGKIYDSNDILTVGIRGIDLAFDYNEFVTIEGESGSGQIDASERHRCERYI